MKLLFLLMLISCSHQLSLVKTKGINKEIMPYVENFKLNHPTGDLASKIQFPINFYDKINTIGVCYLRENKEDQEVLINPEYWTKHPEKRQQIVTYLLSACYGLNAKVHPHYEVHLTTI